MRMGKAKKQPAPSTDRDVSNSSNGCGKYIVSSLGRFSFHGNSPSNEHLTHKFLLRQSHYIIYRTDCNLVFCFVHAKLPLGEHT